MNRRDWLLLLLAFKGAKGPTLDPVRIQKGMFRFSEESKLPGEETYDFEPYHYGPYSRALRADVDSLVRAGLVAEMPVQGYTWSRYRVTDAGMKRARKLHKAAPKREARRLFAIKQDVTGVSFNELLRDLYAQYPDYAERSIFNT